MENGPELKPVETRRLAAMKAQAAVTERARAKDPLPTPRAAASSTNPPTSPASRLTPGVAAELPKQRIDYIFEAAQNDIDPFDPPVSAGTFNRNRHFP